jgi:hypothetical protein
MIWLFCVGWPGGAVVGWGRGCILKFHFFVIVVGPMWQKRPLLDGLNCSELEEGQLFGLQVEVCRSLNAMRLWYH